MLLALTHTLVSEGLHDQAFLDKFCTGFERVLPYLMGDSDGQPKSADWAAPITGVPADTIRALARRMAATRTMVTASWSLQRAHHGEQPYWAVILLASALGQIGLPGGGFGFGYGSGAASAMRRCRLPRPRWTASRIRSTSRSRRRASPTACSIPAALTTSTASAAIIPTSSWSIGPAAIRSTTIRTPTSSAAPGNGPRPSSYTSRGGPRPRATPISCCRPPRRWSATTSAARAATSSSWRCSRRSRRSARRATTSPSSAIWRNGSASPRPTRRAATRTRGSVICTKDAATAPAPTPRRFRISIRSGQRAIWKFPPPARNT